MLINLGFLDDDLNSIEHILLFVHILVVYNIGVAITFLAAVIAEVYAAIELKVAIFVDNYVLVNGYGTFFDMTELDPCPLSLWAIINDNVVSSQVALNTALNTYFDVLDDYLMNESAEYAGNEEFRNRVQVLIKANLIKLIQ